MNTIIAMVYDGTNQDYREYSSLDAIRVHIKKIPHTLPCTYKNKILLGVCQTHMLQHDLHTGTN